MALSVNGTGNARYIEVTSDTNTHDDIVTVFNRTNVNAMTGSTTGLVSFQTSLLPSRTRLSAGETTTQLNARVAAERDANFLPIVHITCPIRVHSGRTLVLPPAIYIFTNIVADLTNSEPVLGSNGINGSGRVIIGLDYDDDNDYDFDTQYYPDNYSVPELRGSLRETNGVSAVSYNGGTVVVFNVPVQAHADSRRTAQNRNAMDDPCFSTFTGTSNPASPNAFSLTSLNRMIIRGSRIVFSTCSGNQGGGARDFDSNPIDAKDTVFQTMASYLVSGNNVVEGRIRNMNRSNLYERVSFYNAGILMGHQPYIFANNQLAGTRGNIYFQHGRPFNPQIYFVEGDLPVANPTTQGFGFSILIGNIVQTVSRKTLGHVVYHENTSGRLGGQTYHPYVFFRLNEEADTTVGRAGRPQIGTVIQRNNYTLSLASSLNPNRNYLNSNASFNGISFPTANTSRGLSPLRYIVKASASLPFSINVPSSRILGVKADFPGGSLQLNDAVRTFDWRSAFGRYNTLVSGRYVRLEADTAAGVSRNYSPYDSPVFKIDDDPVTTTGGSTARHGELNLEPLAGRTYAVGSHQVKLTGLIVTLLKEDMYTDDTRTVSISVSGGNMTLTLPSGTNWDEEMGLIEDSDLFDRFVSIESYTMGTTGGAAINSANTGIGFRVMSVSDNVMTLAGKSGVTHVAQNALRRVRVYIPHSINASSTLKFKIVVFGNTISVEATGTDAATFNWLHYFGYTSEFYLEDKVFAFELTPGRTGATNPLSARNQIEGVDFLRLESPTKMWFSFRQGIPGLNPGSQSTVGSEIDNCTIRMTGSATDKQGYPIVSRYRLDGLGMTSRRLSFARSNDNNRTDEWVFRLPQQLNLEFLRHIIPGTRFRLRVGQSHVQTILNQKNEIDQVFTVDSRFDGPITGSGTAATAQPYIYFRSLMGKEVSSYARGDIPQTSYFDDYTLDFYLNSNSHPFATRENVSFSSSSRQPNFQAKLIKAVNETTVYQGFQNILPIGGSASNTASQENTLGRRANNYRSYCTEIQVLVSGNTITLSFTYLTLLGVYDNDLRALYRVSGQAGQKRPGLSQHNQEDKILVGGIDTTIASQSTFAALQGIHNITALTANTVSFVLPAGHGVTAGNISVNSDSSKRAASVGHANVWDERSWDITVQAQSFDDINYSLSTEQLDGELTQNFVMNLNLNISTDNIGDPNVISTLPSMLRAIEALETRIGIKLVEVVQDGGGDPSDSGESVTVSTAGILDAISGARLTYDIEFRKEAHRTTGTQRAGAELVGNKIVIYSNIGQADDATQNAITNTRDRIPESDRLDSADQNIFGLHSFGQADQMAVKRLICGQLTTPDETVDANSIRVPSTGAINPAFIGDNPSKFLNFALHETRAGSDGKYITPIRVRCDGLVRASLATTSTDSFKMIARFYEGNEGTYGTQSFSLPSGAIHGNHIGDRVYHGRATGLAGTTCGVAIYPADRFLLKKVKYGTEVIDNYTPEGNQTRGKIHIPNVIMSDDGISPTVNFTLDDFIDAQDTGLTNNQSLTLTELNLPAMGLYSMGVWRKNADLRALGLRDIQSFRPYRYSISTNDIGSGRANEATILFKLRVSDNLRMFPSADRTAIRTAIGTSKVITNASDYKIYFTGLFPNTAKRNHPLFDSTRDPNNILRIELRPDRDVARNPTGYELIINMRVSLSQGSLITEGEQEIPASDPVDVHIIRPTISVNDASGFPETSRHGRWFVSKLARIFYLMTRGFASASVFDNGADIISSVSSPQSNIYGQIRFNTDVSFTNSRSIRAETIANDLARVALLFDINLTGSGGTVNPDAARQLALNQAQQANLEARLPNNIGFASLSAGNVFAVDIGVPSVSENIIVYYNQSPLARSEENQDGSIANERFSPDTQQFRRIYVYASVSGTNAFRILITRENYYPIFREVNERQSTTIELTGASFTHALLGRDPADITAFEDPDITRQNVVSSALAADNNSLAIRMFEDDTERARNVSEDEFNTYIISKVFTHENFALLSLRKRTDRLIEFTAGEVNAGTPTNTSQTSSGSGVFFVPPNRSPSGTTLISVDTYIPIENLPALTFGAGASAVAVRIIANTQQASFTSSNVVDIQNALRPMFNEINTRVRRVEAATPEGHVISRIDSRELLDTRLTMTNFQVTTGYRVPTGYGLPAQLTASGGRLTFSVISTVTSSSKVGFGTNTLHASFHPEAGDVIELELTISTTVSGVTNISDAIESIIFQIELNTDIGMWRSVGEVVAIPSVRGSSLTTALLTVSIPIGDRQHVPSDVTSFNILITQIIPRSAVSIVGRSSEFVPDEETGRVLAPDYRITSGGIHLNFSRIEVRRVMNPSLLETIESDVQEVEERVCDTNATLETVTKFNPYSSIYTLTAFTLRASQLTNIIGTGSTSVTLRDVSGMDKAVIRIVEPRDDLPTLVILPTPTGGWNIQDGDRMILDIKAESTTVRTTYPFAIFVDVLGNNTKRYYVNLPRKTNTENADSDYTRVIIDLGCLVKEIGIPQVVGARLNFVFDSSIYEPTTANPLLIVLNRYSLERATQQSVTTADKLDTLIGNRAAPNQDEYNFTEDAVENVMGGSGGGSLSSNQGTALDRLYAMTDGTGSDAGFRGRAFDSLITSAARGNFSDVVTKLNDLSAQDITDLKEMVGDTHDLGSGFWSKLADMGDEWDNMIQDNTVRSTTYQRFKAQALEALFSNGQDTTFGTTGSVLRQVITRLNTMIGLMMGSTTVYQFNANALGLAPTGSGGGTTLDSNQTGALTSLHHMITNNQFKSTALTNALTTAQKTVFTNLTGMIMGSGGSASFKSTAIPAISVGRVQLSTTNETLLARLNSMTTGTGSTSTFMQQAFNNLPSVAVSGTVSLDSALETIITNMEGLISGTGTSSVIRSGAFANLPAVSVTGTVSLDSSLETIITNLGGMQSGSGSSTSFKPTAIPAVDIDGLTNAADLTNLVTSLTAMIDNNVFNDTAFRELYRLMYLLSGIFHVVTGSNTGTQTIKLFKDQSDYDLYISTSGATDRSSITQTVERQLVGGLLSGQNSDVTRSMLQSTWGLGDITS